MKIALIAHNIHDQGGMERYMANLARWLKNHGETVHLYTADDFCPLIKEGFYWKQIPTVNKPLSLRLWLFYYLSKESIPWNDYDIVHSNGGIVPFQNVTTFHFCQPAWGKILKEKTLKDLYQGSGYWRLVNRKLSGFLATHWESQAALNSEAIFSVSAQVARDIKKHYHPSVTPEIIYNGVSLTEFYPDFKIRDELRHQLGVTPDDTMLLFTGGEFGRKGLKTVLQSLTYLEDPAIKLWVAGYDPMENRFKDMVEQLNISSRVFFLGFRGDIPKLMQAADILTFPTIYEPFGMVITEAMASGLPVITTLNAGASELITSGINGLLLDSPKNALMLSQMIELLRTNLDLTNNIRLSALETVKHYSWDKMLESIYAKYQQILCQPEVSAHSAA